MFENPSHRAETPAQSVLRAEIRRLQTLKQTAELSSDLREAEDYQKRISELEAELEATGVELNEDSTVVKATPTSKHPLKPQKPHEQTEKGWGAIENLKRMTRNND